MDKILKYIKPQYFVYSQYYISYLFFSMITYNNIYGQSIYLYLIYLCNYYYHSFKENDIYNNNFKSTSDFIFIYLLFLKFALLNIYIYKKLGILFIYTLFYGMININDVYSERLKCIETKKIFNHNLKILIITPNKDLIKNIIYSTRIFTFSNYLFFINMLLIFL